VSASAASPFLRVACTLLLASCDARGPQPRIQVDAAEVDLGRLYRGEVRTHTFMIGNAGDALLQIADVRRDCVCTLHHLSDQEVEPGESVPIDSELRANLNAGKYEKTLTVRSNDPRNPALTLRFVFEVVDLYRVEPPLIEFGSPVLGEAVTRTCRVRILEGTELEIVTCEGTDGPVGASWKMDPQDRTIAEVGITLNGQAPIGSLTKTITLVTNHPRQPRIPIPVSAQIASPLSVEPASALNFGEFPRAQGATGVVVLRNLDRNQSLRIESVAVDTARATPSPAAGASSAAALQSCASARVETVVEGQEFRVIVTVVPGFTEKLLFGHLEIRTNLAACPVHTLTLFGKAKD
jgi:hypothetical protein